MVTTQRTAEKPMRASAFTPRKPARSMSPSTLAETELMRRPIAVTYALYVISWHVPSAAHTRSHGFGPAFAPPGIVGGSSTTSLCSGVAGKATSLISPFVSLELDAYVTLAVDG